MVYPVSCTAVCYVTVIAPFIKKVGGGPSKFWGSGPPDPPVVAPLGKDKGKVGSSHVLESFLQSLLLVVKVRAALLTVRVWCSQKYNQVAVGELVLSNVGQVGFNFEAVDCGDPGSVRSPSPGQPIIVPHSVSHSRISCRIFQQCECSLLFLEFFL